MPWFFAPLMWLYLVLALAALVVGMFVKDITVKLGKFWSWLPKWVTRMSLPQWLVAGVGVSYIIFVLVFLSYAYIRVNDMGVLLVGTSYIVVGGFELGAEALADFEPGFYLASVVGPLCLLLGLLRNRIVGIPKLGS